MDKDEEETIKEKLEDLESRLTNILTNIEMDIDDFEGKIVNLKRKK
jgi:hypothetical protein